jgi:hypothetical protein
MIELGYGFCSIGRLFGVHFRQLHGTDQEVLHMRATTWTRLGVLAATVILGAVGIAGTARAEDAASVAAAQISIGGANLPSTMQLKDLDSSWKRLTLGGPLDVGHWVQALADYLGTPNPNFAYTKGQTISLGSETYLVAYRPTFKGPGVMDMMMSAGGGTAPEPPKLTGDTVLSLSLLNLRTVGSLDDIRSFDLNTEVADFAKAVQSLQAFIDMMQALKPNIPSMGHEHHAAPKKQPAKPHKPTM